MLPDGTGRIRLVASESLGSGSRPSGTDPFDAQLPHDVREHRSITALPRGDQQHQGPTLPVTQRMDFGAETTA